VSEPQGEGVVSDLDVVFLTHIMSLKRAALMHLGVVDGAEGELDLETAHHLIDVIEALKHKAQGNLSAAEARQLEADLYELKVAYVKASGHG
jgi:hypothetical protein